MPTQKKPPAIARSIPILRHLWVRPRLAFGGIVAVALALLLPHEWRDSTRLLISWDCAAFLYLALTAVLMTRADHADIRRQAARQDDGGLAVLVVTVCAALATLVAIVEELGTAKSLAGAGQAEHVALSAITVVLSWLFMHTMFAVHYAHEYYGDADGNPDTVDCIRGLDFPGEAIPDYWDFMYFSLVIGAAAATADIDVTSPALRRIVALHCVIAFFFNTTILALTINIGASLF